ncbi:1-acyl-sn-glycerol-3-phosphate acyltransferase [bacterium]|nr:1-acyl-sn-glycerol-3-phosphate acyltransferase [bacterium]
MNTFDYYIYHLAGILIRFFVRLLLNFRILRLERRFSIRNKVLVVSNHQSLLDPALIGAFLDELKLSYFAKWELFQVPFLGKFISMMGAFPVKRGTADIEAIRTATSILQNNGRLIMFPEGTRTLDGSIKPFKKGAGFLVARTHCNVVPVFLEGWFQVLPKYGRRRLRYPVRVVVGKLITYEELMAAVPKRNDYTAISEYLYEKVKSLSTEV